MKLTKSMLRPIHGEGKSSARLRARSRKSQIANTAKAEADKVYTGVKKGDKKYSDKLEFIENRIVAALNPREREIAAARKKLIVHLQASAARGRAVTR